MSLLEINNLHTYFNTRKGVIKAVNGISFKLEAGKTLGIVGESGSGKSQTAISILKLFNHNQKIEKGNIIFNDEMISEFTEKQLRKIRGNEISMIFQEPMSSLNPVLTVKRQITEVFMAHQKVKKKEAEEKALEMLKAVKIANPERILKSYPFQLSGGMNQRVMIAIALACQPKLLISDEATTALDVIVQAEILKLMNELQKQYHTSILFITHDLGVVSQMVDDVIVMYGGRIVEKAAVKDIFRNPQHPYTKRLLKAFFKTDINERTSKDSEEDLYSAENELFTFSKFKYESIADDDFYEVGSNHYVACTIL